MTLLDPFTALRLIEILEATSGKWSSKEDMERDIKRLAEGAKAATPPALEPDGDFIIGPVDWSKLGAGSTDANFENEMKQWHTLHTCALNSVRFVLQKRYDVMIGQNRSGDRVVYSLVENRYFEEADYKKDFAPESSFSKKSVDLRVAKTWLATLGIQAGNPVVIADIAQHIKQIRTQNSNPGFLLVAGDYTGADHMYILHEFRTVANDIEAKIYDPWQGKNMTQPLASAGVTDWYDVNDFQRDFALPLMPDGTKIPKLDSSGRRVLDSNDEMVSLRPLDPDLPSNLFYFVMFVPAI